MTSQEKRDHTRYNCSCQKKEKVTLHVRQKVRQSYTLSRLFGHFLTVRKYKLVALRGRLHPPSPWWTFFLFLNSVDGVLLVYLLFCFQRSDLSQVGNVGRDPFNQNSNRSDREKRTTSKGGPVFSKLFRLDRTDPLSFGPKFPEILVEWIAPVMSVSWDAQETVQGRHLSFPGRGTSVCLARSLIRLRFFWRAFTVRNFCRRQTF